MHKCLGYLKKSLHLQKRFDMFQERVCKKLLLERILDLFRYTLNTTNYEKNHVLHA